MAAYTFNHFMRDSRNVGTFPFYVRVGMWLTGQRVDDSPEYGEMRVALAEWNRLVESVGAAMTAAERADPRRLLESRRLAIADAVGLTDSELSAVLDAFEQFARQAPMRSRQYWEGMSIHAMFFGLPVLLLALIVGIVLLILNGPG